MFRGLGYLFGRLMSYTAYVVLKSVVVEESTEAVPASQLSENNIQI